MQKQRSLFKRILTKIDKKLEKILTPKAEYFYVYDLGRKKYVKRRLWGLQKHGGMGGGQGYNGWANEPEHYVPIYAQTPYEIKKYKLEKERGKPLYWGTSPRGYKVFKAK